MSLASSSCLASWSRCTDSPAGGALCLERAHPTCLPPRLVLALADAIHRLRLLLAQSLELDLLRALCPERGQIGRPAGAQRKGRTHDAHMQRDLLEVLPADRGDIEAAEQLACQHDQPAAAGGDEDPAVGEREQPSLDRPGLERLAGDQHRAQLRERLSGSRLVQSTCIAHGSPASYLFLAISARSSRSFALMMRAFAGPMRISSFCPAERLSRFGSAYS